MVSESRKSQFKLSLPQKPQVSYSLKISHVIYI